MKLNIFKTGFKKKISISTDLSTTSHGFPQMKVYGRLNVFFSLSSHVVSKLVLTIQEILVLRGQDKKSALKALDECFSLYETPRYFS